MVIPFKMRWMRLKQRYKGIASGEAQRGYQKIALSGFWRSFWWRQTCHHASSWNREEDIYTSSRRSRYSHRYPESNSEKGGNLCRGMAETLAWKIYHDFVQMASWYFIRKNYCLPVHAFFNCHCEPLRYRSGRQRGIMVPLFICHCRPFYCHCERSEAIPEKQNSKIKG